MTSTVEKKVFIIDDFHRNLLEKLDAANISYNYSPDISASEAIAQFPQYPVIVCRSKVTFTKAILEPLTQLKCIARGGAGMDNIDEKQATLQGITLLNAPEGNRDAVAEHAIGLILSLSNNITKGNAEVKQKIWQREANRGWEIGNKTIGIIGFGNTGKALANKLSGFGSRIIAYDKYVTPNQTGVTSVSLEQLQAEADIVSLHVPLTDETFHMVNRGFVNAAKQGFTLINTSRGPVVDNNAILNGLKSKKIRAFGADVLENENFKNYDQNELMIFEQIAENQNVILTPHVAGWTVESYQKISTVLADKLIDFTTKSKKY